MLVCHKLIFLREFIVLRAIRSNGEATDKRVIMLEGKNVILIRKSPVAKGGGASS
jgi:hypothetical protein